MNKQNIDINLDSFTETSATLSGYIYHIVGGTDEYWWPIDPTDDAVFAYTVYTYDADAEPCITTSVHEEESIHAIIYPNPVYDQVQVEWSEWRNTSTLQIFNATGALVVQHIVIGSTATIPVKQLSSGLYYFVFRSDEEVRTFKIVKQ